MMVFWWFEFGRLHRLRCTMFKWLHIYFNCKIGSQFYLWVSVDKSCDSAWDVSFGSVRSSRFWSASTIWPSFITRTCKKNIFLISTTVILTRKIWVLKRILTKNLKTLNQTNFSENLINFLATYFDVAGWMRLVEMTKKIWLNLTL